MKQLILLFILVPMFLVAMFAADPQGAVIWKSSDLKNFDHTLAAKLDDSKAAVEEFSKAGDYQIAILHREGDGGVELEVSDLLLIIESGQATLSTGTIVDSNVAGGTSRAVAAGDVVLIPANLPHRILVAAGDRVTYLVIRTDNAASSASVAPVSNGKPPALGVDLGSGFRACAPGDNSPDGTVVDGHTKMVSRSFLGPSCLWKPEASPETAATGSTANERTARPGTDVGDGYRSCVAGDNSPSGTIVDGYRKLMSTSPFGVSCGWEKIR
jgi:mannose-6-phosphate isomerase-like protein (cupin superfamily)